MEQVLLNGVSSAFIARFDSLHGLGTGNRLVKLLSHDCNNFTDIGRVFGLSRERIRQLYNREVRHLLLGSKDGHQRQSAWAVVRPHRDDFPEQVLTVRRKAEQMGYGVTHINANRHPYYTLKNTLNINGYKCRVSVSQILFTPVHNYTSYLRMQLRERTVFNDFFIACHKDMSWFYIIPLFELRKERPGKHFYLPATESPRYKSWSRWNKYKDAWDLLRKAPGWK